MARSRSALLCWGQRYHWLRYQHVPAGSRHEAHITDGLPLPDGVTLAQVRTALTYLVRRHEGLRTVFDTRGRQLVQRPVPLPLPEVPTEHDGTPSPAEAIEALAAADFNLAMDWPLRGCVVTTGGAPKLLHLVFNHLAFDDVSLALLRTEFQTVLAGMLAGRPAVLPPVGSHPVDLAAAESARPRESVDAALEHWRAEISRLPADMFATRRDPGRTAAAHSASLTSPWLLGAAQEIAGRARVWPVAVHLAAYAVAAAAYTGQPVIANRIYTSQRDNSGQHSLMTCMSFPALVSVQVGDDPTFGEVLRRAARQVERALANAHVPYDELVELVGLEGELRGQPVRVASELNFLNNAPRSCGTRRDRFTRNPAPVDWLHAGSDTYLRVYEWSDGVTLMLQARTEVMDSDAVESFLRGYLAVLDTHRDPAVDLRVSEAAEHFGGSPPPRRPVVWVRDDPVDVEATAAALRQHDAVESVQLAIDARGLVAHVTASAPVTPARLRAHLLDAAYDHPAVRCPDLFQIVPSDDPTAGLPPGPPEEGDGREHSPAHPDGAAERDLAAAVAAANGLGDGGGLDLAASYREAGARALAMPAVLAALADRGWWGIGQDHLASARPLGALARRLERV